MAPNTVSKFLCVQAQAGILKIFSEITFVSVYDQGKYSSPSLNAIANYPAKPPPLNLSTHLATPSFQKGISISRAARIFEVSNTEYNGRTAGVG